MYCHATNVAGGGLIKGMVNCNQFPLGIGIDFMLPKTIKRLFKKFIMPMMFF